MPKTKCRGNTDRPPPPKKSKSRKRDVTKRKAERPVDDNDNAKKVKRDDTSQRKKDNKSCKFCPVKASLAGRWGTFCSPAVRDIMIDVIEKYVQSISQLVVKGAMVADEALIQYLRQNQVPPDLSTTFFRQCMTGESTDPVIQQVLQTQFHNHPPIERSRGDGDVLNYAVNLYYTNFDNGLWMHFEDKLRDYVKKWVSLNHVNEHLANPIVNGILGRPVITTLEIPDIAVRFVQEERAILGDPDNFVPENTSTELLLRYTFRMLEFKRQHNLSKGFTLAPLPEYKRHHINICTTVLYYILKEVFDRLGEDTPEWIQEAVLLPRDQAIHVYQDMMWSHVLDTSGLSHERFMYRIVTDGVQASFMFKRPKREPQPVKTLAELCQTLPPQEILRIITIDPGRTNVITAYDPTYNRFFTLSRKSYYGPMAKSHAKIRKWEDPICDIFVEMSQFSLKTSDENMRSNYRRVYFEQYDRLWSARLLKKRSREAFRLYSIKRSVIDRFFMSFMKGTKLKPIIVYGGATMRSSGRGEMSVPVKAVLKRCRQFYHTVLVNEHLTTKCHSECGSRMHPVKRHGEQKTVRGLLYCPVCHQFVNRDRDACKSIHHAATFEKRPFYLRFNRPFQYMQPRTLLPARQQ